MLMFLGRSGVEQEICISFPGADGRHYELRIQRSHEGPSYRLGLLGRPCTALQGFAVFEAIDWLGVPREVVRRALSAAVVKQTLLHHQHFCQGRTLLDREQQLQVELCKESHAHLPSIVALARGCGVPAKGSPETKTE